MANESMQLTRVSSFEDIGAECWQELHGRSPGATVFQDYYWLRSWWQCCREEGDELVLFAVHAGERLVAVAPLFLSRARGDAAFVGDSHSDYQLFLHDGTYAGVLERLVEEIYRWSAGRCRVALREVPETDPLAAALFARSRGQLDRCVVADRTACPRIDVAAEPDIIDRLLRKQSLKRHAAALGKLGSVTIDHITDAAEASRHLDNFFDQHVRRWSVTPFPSLFLRDRNRRFYRELTQQVMVGGKAMLTVVTLDGGPVAYHFGLLSGTDFIWYKPSFDITLWKESPGESLLKELLAKAKSDGRKVFDFTRGDEGFKTRFANQVRFNRSFVVERSGAAAGARRSAAAFKAAARRVASLPVMGRLVAWLRGSAAAADDEKAGPRALLRVDAVLGHELRVPGLEVAHGEWRLEEAALPEILASFEQGKIPAEQRARLPDWFPRLRKQQRCWLLYDGGARAIGCVWRAAATSLDDALLVAALERARATECAHGLELWGAPRSSLPALLTAVAAVTGASVLASRGAGPGMRVPEPPAAAWRFRRIEVFGRRYDAIAMRAR